MSDRLRTVAFSALALWQLSGAVPADPVITPAALLPRQNSDNFIGYLEANNTWSSLNCNSGLTWYQSGQYAQCCPETLTHCYAPTACVAGSQIYTYPDITSVRTIACTDNYNNAALSICNTIFIFENSQDSNPKTNINCGDSSANWSYYRDIPTTAKGSAPQASSTGPAGSTTGQKTESGSKAWIAGAVIGPIVGLALVVLGVWFFLRRKKKAAKVPQYGTASMAPVDPSQPPAGVGGYTDAKPQFQPAQPTYYNQPGQPDPYTQQGYPQQGGFSPAQGSPVPQYGFQSAYDSNANPPTSGTYTNDAKYEQAGAAAELGDSSKVAPAAPSTPGSPPPHTAPTSPVAELSGANVESHGNELPGGDGVQSKPR